MENRIYTEYQNIITQNTAFVVPSLGNGPIDLGPLEEKYNQITGKIGGIYDSMQNFESLSQLPVSDPFIVQEKYSPLFINGFTHNKYNGYEYIFSDKSIISLDTNSDNTQDFAFEIDKVTSKINQVEMYINNTFYTLKDTFGKDGIIDQIEINKDGANILYLFNNGDFDDLFQIRIDTKYQDYKIEYRDTNADGIFNSYFLMAEFQTPQSTPRVLSWSREDLNYEISMNNLFELQIFELDL